MAKGVINDIKDFNKDSHAKFKENINNGKFISAFGEAFKAGAYNSVGFVAGIFAAETVAVTSGLEAAGKALFGTASSSAIENATQSGCIGGSTALSNGELKDFVEKFEESQKTNSEPKRKAPSFKRNPNYKGSIKEILNDKKNIHTRTMEMRYEDIENLRNPENIHVIKDPAKIKYKDTDIVAREKQDFMKIDLTKIDPDNLKQGDLKFIKNHKFPKEGLKLEN